MALAARASKADRAEFATAIDGGGLVLAPSLRAAIHTVPPDDLSLHGRTAISNDDDELARQLGQGAMKGLRRHRIAPTDALAEVAEATLAFEVERLAPLDRDERERECARVARTTHTSPAFLTPDSGRPVQRRVVISPSRRRPTDDSALLGPQVPAPRSRPSHRTSRTHRRGDHSGTFAGRWRLILLVALALDPAAAAHVRERPADQCP